MRLFISLTIVCVAEFTYSCNAHLEVADSGKLTDSMSACLGIPTQKVDTYITLGSGLAGVAGCAISFLGSVGPIPVKTILWIRSWLWWLAV